MVEGGPPLSSPTKRSGDRGRRRRPTSLPEAAQRLSGRQAGRPSGLRVQRPGARLAVSRLSPAGCPGGMKGSAARPGERLRRFRDDKVRRGPAPGCWTLKAKNSAIRVQLSLPQWERAARSGMREQPASSACRVRVGWPPSETDDPHPPRQNLRAPRSGARGPLLPSGEGKNSATGVQLRVHNDPKGGCVLGISSL